MRIILCVSALIGSSYLLGQSDSIGSEIVYYPAVFLALFIACAVASAFVAMFFYKPDREFKSVWLNIMPLICSGVFILNLLPNGS